MAMSLSSKIKLGIFIPTQVPSIICHMFLIYHLISNPQLRKALHNHVIIVFLIINFLLITTDLSIIFHYLRFGFIEEDQIDLCLSWNFIDAFLSNLSTFLMMWASLERHLLIFYDRQIYNNNLKRFIFHYLPIFILILYAFVFYSFAIFIHPNCSNSEHFHYDEVFCGRACYVHSNLILSAIDLLLNRILCSILIFIFNLFLILRVLYEKRQRNQIIRWRRHKKMAIQVLSISTLYLIGTLPAAIAELFHIFEINTNGEEESVIQEEIFLYLFYFDALIIPFICLMSLPEIYTKIPFLRRPLNVISNVTFSVRRNQVNVDNLHIRRTAAY